MIIQKKPFLFSVLLTLLLLVFPILSGTIIAIFEIGDLPSRLIQALAFLMAAFLGCAIAKKTFGSLSRSGLRKSSVKSWQENLWFIPLILVEILPLLFGVKAHLSFFNILAYMLFTLAVGFTEELYFRGLILGMLRQKGLGFAVLLSSALFSIGHLANLLAGASLVDTLLQILFAMVFGIVAALISVSTESLLIPMFWHFAHNFFSLITAGEPGLKSHLFGTVQFLILALYAVFLWSSIRASGRDVDASYRRPGEIGKN